MSELTPKEKTVLSALTTKAICQCGVSLRTQLPHTEARAILLRLADRRLIFKRHDKHGLTFRRFTEKKRLKDVS